MPAVPKRKTSKQRRDNRRSHDGLVAMNLSVDKESGEMKQSHRLDMSTGRYKGRTLMKVKK